MLKGSAGAGIRSRFCGVGLDGDGDGVALAPPSPQPLESMPNKGAHQITVFFIANLASSPNKDTGQRPNPTFLGCPPAPAPKGGVSRRLSRLPRGRGAAESLAVAPTARKRYLYLRRTEQMPRYVMGQLTDLLERLRGGDAEAREALFAAAYPELRALAQARLRHGGRNTLLDTTGLVHESYLRFVGGGQLRAEDRRAFFAYASQVMRSVILNGVRERVALKRGGDQPSSEAGPVASELPGDEQTVLDVHEALNDLEKAEPRLAQVAEMRYFGGYSEKEIAETLEIAERSVQRDWEKARLILAAALR
jgi:RNA polymerase sigma factor (TIGR02999 family)